AQERSGRLADRRLDLGRSRRPVTAQDERQIALHHGEPRERLVADRRRGARASGIERDDRREYGRRDAELLAQRRRHLAELSEDHAALARQRAVAVGLEPTQCPAAPGARPQAERLERVLGEPLRVVDVDPVAPAGPAGLAARAGERDREPSLLYCSGVCCSGGPEAGL